MRNKSFLDNSYSESQNVKIRSEQEDKISSPNFLVLKNVDLSFFFLQLQILAILNSHIPVNLDMLPLTVKMEKHLYYQQETSVLQMQFLLLFLHCSNSLVVDGLDKI